MYTMMLGFRRVATYRNREAAVADVRIRYALGEAAFWRVERDGQCGVYQRLDLWAM